MNQIGSRNKYTNFIQSETGLILIFVLIKFLIHFYTNAFAGYGIFRDELYYLSCASRPAFGYVDQPPLSIWFLTFYRSLFGDSIFMIRMVPAVLGALTIWITGKITKEMGGNRTALFISLSAALLTPIYLAMNSHYSMNSIDIFLWTVTFYLLIKLIKEDSIKLWVLLGITLGFGLLNKISFLWMGFGIAHSMMIMSKGKIFLKKGIWIAGIISAFIFLPFIVWNLTHDMAHFEFIKNARQLKYAGLTRMDFIKDLFLIMNPVSALIWIPGLYWLFIGKRKKEFRVIGLIVFTVFLILLINGKSKAEYISAAMTPLLAAGGIFYEEIGRNVVRRLLAYGITTSVIVSGIILSPIALPILPAETFIKYSEALGFRQPSAEGKELDSLPQFFADMHGWEKMADDVSKVYQMVPEQERENTVAWGSNYGRAGAIEYYSSKYPLPKAISTHNNFWLWGYGDKEIKNVIFIGGELKDYENSFETVKEVLIHHAQYVMPYENNLTIFLCSGPKAELSDIWPKYKHFE